MDYLHIKFEPPVLYKFIESADQFKRKSFDNTYEKTFTLTTTAKYIEDDIKYFKYKELKAFTDTNISYFVEQLYTTSPSQAANLISKQSPYSGAGHNGHNGHNNHNNHGPQNYQNQDLVINVSFLYAVATDFISTRDSIKPGQIPTKIYFMVLSNNLYNIQQFLNLKQDSNQQYKIIAKLLKLNEERNKTFSNIISKVQTADKSILIKINKNKENYNYTIKIDGVRTLLFLCENNQQIVVQAKLNNVSNNFSSVLTILDGEEYKGVFYIFDILMENKINIMGRSYKKRLEVLSVLKLPKNCVLKKFFPLDNLSQLSIIFERLYENIYIDGVIINNLNTTYLQTEAYKVKDRKFQTIDCMVKVPQLDDITKRFLNVTNQPVYTLYVGSNADNFRLINDDIPSNQAYQPMLFALPFYKVQPCQYMILDKSFEKYIKKQYGNEKEVLETFYAALAGKYKDGDVLELAYDEDMRPFPIRYRDDKTKEKQPGNNFITAYTNYLVLLDPITQDFLDNPVDDSYFNKDQNEINSYDINAYDDFRTFGHECRKNGIETCIKYIKEYKFDRVLGGRLSAVDIGAGRNSDYFMYLNNKFENFIAYEPDKKANIIYYNRMIQRLRQQKNNQNITTYIVNQFIDSPVLQQLSAKYTVNMINANYMIHYLCDSAKTIKTLKNFILTFCKQGGVFHCLYYDGKLIYNYLKDHDNLFDNGKYQIQSSEDMDSFASFGQEISVWLPTINTELTKEFLVNIQAIIDIFKPEIQLIVTQKYNVDYLQEDDKLYCSFIRSSYFKIK